MALPHDPALNGAARESVAPGVLPLEEILLVTLSVAVVVKTAAIEDRNPYVWCGVFALLYCFAWLALGWWPIVRVGACLAAVYGAMFVANLMKPVD